MLKADLHIHTSASKDGESPVKAVIKAAEDAGLDVIAITDHDTMEGYIAAKAIQSDLIIIPGIEISTKEGHLLALGIEDPPLSGLPVLETINEVRKRGGITILPHPFHKYRHGAALKCPQAFEDYVTDADQPDDDPLNDKVEASPGHRFLTSEGIRWADTTYIDLVGLNVNKDFYDKANYVDAFFTFISKARDYYEQYIDDRSMVSSVSFGEESYDNSKSYYEEAEKAISYFNDILPEGNNTTLPDFPKFGEIEMGGDILSGLDTIESDFSEKIDSMLY